LSVPSTCSSILVICLGMWLFFPPDVNGTTVKEQKNPAVADTTTSDKNNPNSIPYASSRTFGEHLLALPSYLLHWTTRPIGYGVKFLEREFPELFELKVPNSGIAPYFETGSKNAKIAYGIIAYHKNFLSPGNELRFHGLFGSESYNSFELDYAISTFLAGELEIDASYANNPEQSLYGGNNSTLEEKQLFSAEELEGSLAYKQQVSPILGLRLNSSFKKLTIGQGDVDDSPGGPIADRMLGTTSLVTIGGSASYDFTKGKPRTYLGPRIAAGLDWSQSINSTDFRFLTYTIEWDHFLPVFFLPKTRRLAFKSRLQKVEPLKNSGVPFFEYPTLGSNQDLRGFTGNRFRDDGSLLLTLEYRYPIWDFADLVLFVDEGQVFDSYSDIHISDFHTDYGFGFHIISGGGFSFRTEFAFSNETSRFILSVTPNI